MRQRLCGTTISFDSAASYRLSSINVSSGLFKTDDCFSQFPVGRVRVGLARRVSSYFPRITYKEGIHYHVLTREVRINSCNHEVHHTSVSPTSQEVLRQFLLSRCTRAMSHDCAISQLVSPPFSGCLHEERYRNVCILPHAQVVSRVFSCFGAASITR